MIRGLFLLGFLCALETNAQSYLISFAGSGESTTVNTVKVQNLRSGEILSLNGSDVLRLNVTVGIPDVGNEKSSGVRIYPNPMAEKSKLIISAPVAGDAIISVSDITGKVVTHINSYLENHAQEFTLSGLKDGIYIINVKGNTYLLSGKLISNGKLSGPAGIEKSGDIISVNNKVSASDAKGPQATVDMEYTIGDILLTIGGSGDYSTVATAIPVEDGTVTFEFSDCTDGDGNHYTVVNIGDQIWMAENLKTTSYRNAELIGTTSPATLDISAETAPKYQWAYDGNNDNVDTYGRLYTWYAVTDGRFVCPVGWHLPTDDEWTVLTDYLGGDNIAGGKLKETGFSHWEDSYDLATNLSGFTALPGGTRNSNGTFLQMRYSGFIWSATSFNASTAWHRMMDFLNSTVSRDNYFGKRIGLSVRCVKD